MGSNARLQETSRIPISVLGLAWPGEGEQVTVPSCVPQVVKPECCLVRFPFEGKGE